MKKLLGVALLLVAIGCGGDGNDGTGPTTYENISGTYAGVVAGTTQGIVLNATFTLTITQSQGTLGGSSSISGTLSDGIDTVPVQGSGTISGTIASGNNPSVNITATSGICPNVKNTFSGAYDSTNRKITLSGSLKVFDGACQVLLTYSGTMILSR